MFEHGKSDLSLVPIAQNPNAGRWRTEAMRSHATPRLLHIAKGQGRVTIAGLTSGYGANNLIFIPAKTMYGFEVGPTVFGQLLTIPAAMASEWPDDVVHLRLRDVIVQRELLSLFDAMEKEIKLGGDQPSRAAHYHLGLLSVFFERQKETRTDDRDHAKTSAARLVAAYSDLIERDFRKSMGVADYAKRLGVTPTHLTRCCNQTCDRSAHALLSDRIHFEACLMLRESREPVQDIAAKLGFRSAAYFSRAFHSRTGSSPSLFRRTGAAPQRKRVHA